MAKHDVPLVPTLSPIQAWLEKAPAAMRPKVQGRLDRIGQMLATARRLRVRLVAGSDAAAASEHGKNVEELVAMGHLGVPAPEVLRAATVEAAALLGLAKEIGTVEAGKQADLIAVDGDPLADLKALRKVSFVMRSGRIYREPTVGQRPR